MARDKDIYNIRYNQFILNHRLSLETQNQEQTNRRTKANKERISREKSYIIERRPNVCKKEKLEESGKPERKMPLSTTAKFRGGTKRSSPAFSQSVPLATTGVGRVGWRWWESSSVVWSEWWSIVMTEWRKKKKELRRMKWSGKMEIGIGGDIYAAVVECSGTDSDSDENFSFKLYSETIWTVKRKRGNRWTKQVGYIGNCHFLTPLFILQKQPLSFFFFFLFKSILILLLKYSFSSLYFRNIYLDSYIFNFCSF